MTLIHHLAIQLRHLLLLLCLLAFLGTAWAQVPPGGYMPHPVQGLVRVPEPPGGLIPYRKGQLWGYADTTGRVVIRPVFEYEPEVFLCGFGQVVTRLPYPKSAFAKRYARPGSMFLFLNARGDLLWADRRHAVLLRTDSSLTLIKKKGHYFDSAAFCFGRTTTGWPVLRKEQLLPPEGLLVDAVGGLGADRGIAYYRLQKLPAKVNMLASQLRRAALLDKQGRLLTGFNYASIYPFRHGVARFEQTGRGSDQWGLLDRQGRELLPGVYEAVEDGGLGRLLANRQVGRERTCFLLDTLGRRVGPVRHGAMYWVAPGQVLSWGEGAETGWRLLNSDGSVLCNGRVFTRVDRHDNGTVLVQDGPGRAGVLSPDLRWLVPVQPQRFYYISAFDIRKPDAYWRTTQFVARGRQHHVLSLRDGRFITTTAYDTILTSFGDVYFGAVRNGRHYVLNRQGREIAEGDIVPDHGDSYRWHPDGRNEGLCAPPMPWVPVVRGGREVALLDSLGRPQTAWWPYEAERGGHGCPPPIYTCNGLSIVTRCGPASAVGVGDRSRQLVIPFGKYSVQYRDGLYLVGHEPIRLFTETGTAVPFEAKVTARLLQGGWAVSHQALVNRDGRTYSPPPNQSWKTRLLLGGSYESYPFEFGFWKTEWGYVTIHGRQLWGK